MPPSNDLQGLTVMVTRPAHQARALCEMIESRGGHVICFPVLEIADVEDPGPVAAQIGRLHAYDIGIFVSANAVAKGVPMVLARRPWPAHTRIAAIGERTGRELENHGLRVDIRPVGGYNSESLLAAGELHAVGGKNVIIFRGQGGRELLAQTLAQRGAHVDYAEVYRRVRPAARLGEALQAHPFPDIIVITSGEGLENLHAMADEGERARLLATPLLVISQRIGETARALGFTQPPVVSGQASDEGIVEAIRDWWAGNKNAEQTLQ